MRYEIAGFAGTLMQNQCSTAGARLQSVMDFHLSIADGTYRNLVEQIRKAKASGENTRPLKDRLPLYVVAGDVTGRRKLETVKGLTGLGNVDIDGLTAGECDDVMANVGAYPWIVEAHRSCSGLGVHLIVALGVIAGYDLTAEDGRQAYQKEYRRRYAMVARKVEEIFGVKVDEQCKDCLRGIYPSYDTQAYIRPANEVECFEYEDEAYEAVHNSALITQHSELITHNSAPMTHTSDLLSSVNLDYVIRHLQYNQYKPSKRHAWWIGFSQYLRSKGVERTMLPAYQKMMEMTLRSKGLVRGDDPLRRSSTEVCEAMDWGYEHSDVAMPDADTSSDGSSAHMIDDTPDDSDLLAMLPHALPLGLKESLYGVDDKYKLPILGALMPVCMTYATDVSFEYCDGRRQRLNGMAVIFGRQSSGKSTVANVINIWKQPMMEADMRVRIMEDEYKTLMRTRKQNEKLPPPPSESITEVPFTISCSTLLKRLKQSGGRHLYSFAEEIDTMNKTNRSGAWAEKRDVYRLGFDNGMWGQDYNSDMAESGMANVAYNWSVLGTLGAVMRFFSGESIESGLAGRILFGMMPSESYEYMPQFKEHREQDKEAIRKAIERLKAAKGDIDVPRLRKRMTKWCNSKADEARKTGDAVLDTFRKRSAVIGFRCGVVYHILEAKPDESNSCLQFAEVMSEYTLKYQCLLFSKKMTDTAAQLADCTGGYASKNKSLFDMLPEDFTYDMLRALRPSSSKNALRTMVCRWKSQGRIKEVKANQWHKIG